uniref:neuropilin-1-like n=1 Tax=Myxine glutinosa TaxID=7769 RepID=UPI00358F373C
MKIDDMIGMSAVTMTKLLFSLMSLTHGLVEGATCGGEIVVKNLGFLTSPGYPSDYPPHESCHWTLRASEPGQRLLLSFDPLFDLDVSNNCRDDFVELRNGDGADGQLIGHFCHSPPPEQIFSLGSVVTVTFQSDHAQQDSGFKLHYNVTQDNMADSCSLVLDEQTGYLQSPGHPGPYGPDLMCNYTITSVPPFQVHVIFSAFQLEGASDTPSGEPGCPNDSLEIWDGRPLSGKLIGRYCGDQSPGEVQSSRGVLSLLFSTNGIVSAGGFKAIYHRVMSTDPQVSACNNPLGFGGMGITRGAMVTSSDSTPFVLPLLPQLDSLHAWKPASSSRMKWIQVDFGTLQLVTAVATQGGGQRPLGFEQFVSKYRLEISADGINWKFLAEDFEGNTDGTTVELQTLKEPVVTQFVRLHPQTWQGAIALRSEVYGCSITDRPCSQSLNMAAGSLPHLELTASSNNGPHWTAPQGRLLATRGWVPQNRSLLSSGEWIQVDLGDIRRVGGLLLQGVQGEAKFTNGQKSQEPLFVQEFQLKYSKDGETWFSVSEKGSQQPKVFEGSRDADIPVLRTFPHQDLRWLRLYPSTWSSFGAGLRLDLLGCSVTDEAIGKAQEEECKPWEPCAIAHQAGAEVLVMAGYQPDLDPASDPSFGPRNKKAIARPHQGHLPFGLNCSFGQGNTPQFCSWMNDDHSKLHWKLGKGGAAAIDSGYFLYMEAEKAGDYVGGVARMLSPALPARSSGHCLKFRFLLRNKAPGSAISWGISPATTEKMLLNDTGGAVHHATSDLGQPVVPHVLPPPDEDIVHMGNSGSPYPTEKVQMDLSKLKDLFPNMNHEDMLKIIQNMQAETSHGAVTMKPSQPTVPHPMDTKHIFGGMPPGLGNADSLGDWQEFNEDNFDIYFEKTTKTEDESSERVLQGPSLQVVTRSQTPLGMNQQKLWALQDPQQSDASQWRKIGVLLPRDRGPYQVVLEGALGLAPHGQLIAIDDVRVTHDSPWDCTNGKAFKYEDEHKENDPPEPMDGWIAALALLSSLLIMVVVAVVVWLVLRRRRRRRCRFTSEEGCHNQTAQPPINAYAFELLNGLKTGGNGGDALA